MSETKVEKLCSVCGNPKIKARGMCKKDYEKWLASNTVRAWKKADYPSDEGLVQLAMRFDKMRDLAAELGIRRESLKDYLGRRPALKEAVQQALNSNKVVIGKQVSQRNWVLRNRDKVREYNRRWAKNQDPVNRARWNSYNRERRKNMSASLMTELDVEFASIIRKDPCSYCLGFEKPTLDHIIPIESGGTSEWENLTGACHSCNSSKNDEHLLKFMLRRALETDALKKKECSNG